ncbi:unnamed protein product [Pylaiella littoralis]
MRYDWFNTKWVYVPVIYYCSEAPFLFRLFFLFVLNPWPEGFTDKGGRKFSGKILISDLTDENQISSRKNQFISISRGHHGADTCVLARSDMLVGLRYRRLQRSGSKRARKLRPKWTDAKGLPLLPLPP